MSDRLQLLGIDRLPVRERLELIEQIWDSLPEHVELDQIPEWHCAELVQRRAAVEKEPGVGRPWREALDSIESGS